MKETDGSLQMMRQGEDMPPNSELERIGETVCLAAANAKAQSNVEHRLGVAQRLGVRWLAGNGADTAFGRTQSFEVSSRHKAVCAPTPHPPQSKTLARRTTR